MNAGMAMRIHHSSFIIHLHSSLPPCVPAFPTFTSPIRRTRSLPRTVPWPSRRCVGLLFGLLAPLAMLSSVFWLVPAIGLFFGDWALRRIKRDPAALTGRKLAWAGLSLSLLFVVAAPTDWLVYRRIVRNEARQFSTLWFRYLTHDEPQKAHQLTLPPQARQPLGDNLWAFYRNNPRSRQALEGYVKTPLVRTLLGVGAKGHGAILRDRRPIA